MNILRSARAPYALALLLTVLGLFPTVGAAQTRAPEEFFSVAPCRIYDSRVAGGPLSPGTVYNFTLPACGVPAEAQTIVVNATVVDPTTAGYVAIFPGATPPVPPSNVLSFEPLDEFLGLILTLQVGPGAQLGFQANMSGGTYQLAIDVMGYYMNPNPPTLTAGGALSYAENAAATPIDTTLTVSDPDNAGLQSATVQITGGYQNGEDVLSFVNTATITATFDAGTGTLTLTGADTLLNWQTALRSVSYNNTSDDPSTAARTITWIGNDGSASSAPVTSTINVSAENDRPVLTAGGVLSYNEGDPPTAIDNTITVSDPDNANLQSATVQITGGYQNGEDVLSFVNTATITAGAFDTATGTLILTGDDTVANWQAALRSVRYNNTSANPLTALRTVSWISSDGSLSSTPVTSAINLASTNSPPTITAIADQTIDEDTSTAALPFTVGDPETADASLVVTGTSSNPTLIPNANIVIGGVSPNLTVTVTPVANGNGGPVTITITVDDTSGQPNSTVTETFDVTITATNDQPTITAIGDQVIDEDTSTGALPFTIADQETAVGSLTLTATSSDQAIIPDANIVIGGTGGSRTVTVTPAANANGGPVTITITVNDGSGAPNATAAETFDVTVTAVNDQPTISDVTDQTINEDTSTNSLPVTVGDTETAVGSLTLSGTSSDQAIIPNANIVFGGSGANRTVTVTPAANANGGPVTITITVNDGSGTPNATASDTFNVTVTAVNDAPTVTPIADQTIDEDTSTGALPFTIGDQETPAGSLTVTATSSDQALIPDANVVLGGSGANRTVTVTPVANQFGGPVTITITVNDGGGSPAIETFTVTVTSVNDQPTITGIGNQTIDEDTSTPPLAFTIGDIETAAGSLTVSGTSSNGTIIPNANIVFGGSGANRTVTVTPAANQFGGPVTITITVNDGSGGGNATNSTTFNVTVNSVNDQPTITAIGNQTIDEDTSTGPLAFIVGDVETAAGTLTVSGTSSIGTIIPNGNIVFGGSGANRTVTVTPAANQFGGPVTITITVNDGSGQPNATNSTIFTVTVNAVNDAPSVVVESFDVIGNTELRVDMTAGTTPHASETTAGASVYEGVLDNDGDPEGDTVKVTAILNGCSDPTAPFDCTLSDGAVVHVDENGEFSYTPGPGDTSGSFTYTVTDVPAQGTPLSVNGTVTFNFFERVWYVDPAAGINGSGTSASPFNTLDALDGGADSDQPSDYIFVHDGTLALSGPMPMEANQRLIGQGHVAFTSPPPANVNYALSIPVNLNGNGTPTTLVETGARPQLANASGNTVTVTTEIPIEIVGLSLAGGTTAGGGSCGSPNFACNAIDLTSAAGLTGSSTLTIGNNQFRGAGAEGIDVNLNAGTTGTLTLNVSNNSWDAAGTHTGNAVDINRVAGNLRLNFSNNTNVVSAATAVNINGGAAANTIITGFANNTVHQNTIGTAISVTNATFDADAAAANLQPVSGGSTVIGVSGDGVGGGGLLMSAVSGDLTFTDLDVFTSGGAGISVAGTGTFTGAAGTRLAIGNGLGVGPGEIDATGGPAVSVSSATIDLQLTRLRSANSPTTGLALNSVAGVFSAESGSSITNITNAAGTAFQVGSSSANVTYKGSINTSTGKGVDLTSNTGAIGFTGALTLSSGTNTAFNATGGGTVTATETSSTLTTTTAAALNVVNTTIGSNGLRFRSIASNGGGTPGIVLNSTGSSGGLVVGGNGGTCSSAANCTGGAIQNKTVDGISLQNTRGVSLTRMFIDNNDGSGIFGDDVTDFSLINSMVTNNADTATGAEAGLRFNELLGTCAITNSTIRGSSEDNIRITPTSGVLSQLTISGGSIGFNSPTTGGHGVSLIGTGTAQATVDITGVTFESIRSSGVIANITDTGSINVGISNNIFRDSGAAITLQTSSSADLTFEVLNNTEIVRAISNAIQLVAGSNSTPSSEIRGTISGNVVGNGTADSGSRDMFGIALDLRGDQDAVIAVNNNNVRNSDFEGIWVSSADFGTLAGPSARLDLTMRDNTVGAPDDNSGFPVGLLRGMLVDGRHTTTVCLDMFSNTSAGIGGGEHFRLRQRDTATFQVERLSDGDGTPNELLNNVATIESHVVSQNDAGSTADVTLVNGFFEAANGACRKP